MYDLSNKKSEGNLAQWSSLLSTCDYNNSSFYGPSSPHGTQLSPLLADIESTPIPVLIVGCKLDLAPERASQVIFLSFTYLISNFQKK